MRPGQVLLLSGPAGSGKSTLAGRIAQSAGWVHVEEDDAWVAIKQGHPPGEPRTTVEQDSVLGDVTARVLDLAAEGKNVVLDFVLYEDPPRPLLHSQASLAAAGILVETRLLRVDISKLAERMAARGRLDDRDRERARAHAENQLRVLDSASIRPDWILDATADVEVIYAREFVGLVGGPGQDGRERGIGG